MRMGSFRLPRLDSFGFWLLAQRAPKAWDPLELTLVFADLATFAAYAVIPLLIGYFLLRRRHVHFSRVWFLLVVYLLVGGAVHVLSAMGGWEPAVRGDEGRACLCVLDLGARADPAGAAAPRSPHGRRVHPFVEQA
jgi:hypothetical protein